MKAAFTICSLNYLAQARVAKQSFEEYHENIPFYIFLVDRISGTNNEYLSFSDNVIGIEEIKHPKLSELIKKYSIIELNTAVKPYCFQYLFSTLNFKNLIYIDPDICFYNSISIVFHHLSSHAIVVTPHIMNPIMDDFQPTDVHTLRGGVFNFGFLGLSYSDETKAFLYWWRDRVENFGYADFSQNRFYDQIWGNYIPCFYNNVSIIKDFGYNVANWNLHERLIELVENPRHYLVNNSSLIFFHFSGFDLSKPNVLCQYNTRYDFNNRPDVRPLFEEYHEKVLRNDWVRLHTIPCAFFDNAEKERSNFNDSVFYRFKKIFR